MSTPTFRDLENLSAYLDGQLSRNETRRLETRLKSDADLRSALDDLRRTRELIHRLPHHRSPRNFTLTPNMVRLRPPLPRLYPIFRFAASIAALLLIFTFAANFAAPMVALPMLAKAPAALPYGMGGEGGETPAEPEALMTEQPAGMEALEAPALAEPPQPISTPTPEQAMTATEIVGDTVPEAAPAAPSERTIDKNITPAAIVTEQVSVGGVGGGPESAPAVTTISTFPWLWIEIGLGFLVVGCGLTAFFIRRRAIRKWHQRAK